MESIKQYLLRNNRLHSYCRQFIKIIKESEISFQFSQYSYKPVRNVRHMWHRYLTKFHFDTT